MTGLFGMLAKPSVSEARSPFLNHSVSMMRGLPRPSDDFFGSEDLELAEADMPEIYLDLPGMPDAPEPIRVRDPYPQGQLDPKVVPAAAAAPPPEPVQYLEHDGSTTIIFVKAGSEHRALMYLLMKVGSPTRLACAYLEGCEACGYAQCPRGQAGGAARGVWLSGGGRGGPCP